MQICHWYEPADEPGARILIPGCGARIDNPDRCTCTIPPAPAPLVKQLRGKLAESYAAHRRLLDELSALGAAIAEHPDMRQINARYEEIRKARRL